MRVIFILLLGILFSSQSMGQKDMPLSKFIRQLSEDHALEVAIDPVLLDQYAVNAGELKKEKLMASLQAIFAGAGLDFYQLDANQILLRKSHLSETGANTSISGVIRDRITLSTLGYASIYTPDLKHGTISDESGAFTLIIPESERTDSLIVSYVGYELQKLHTPLKQNLEVFMKPSISTIESITVVASARYMVANNPMEYNGDFHSYKLINFGGKDLIGVLQNLPGLAKTETAEVRIRGLKSDKTLTLVENIPVLKTGHYYNIISSFNELYFDEVEVFKNQYPSAYGNALGGIVRFGSTNNGSSRFKSTSNLLYSGFAADVNAGKTFSIKAGGRISYLGINDSGLLKSNFNQLRIDQVTAQNGIIVAIPDARFYDFNAKASFEYSKRGSINFDILQSSDNTSMVWQNNKQFFIQNQNVTITQKFNNKQESKNEGLGFTHTYRLGKETKWITEAIYNKYQDSFKLMNKSIDFLGGFENTINTEFQHRQEVSMGTLKSMVLWQVGKNQKFTQGIEAGTINLKLKGEENRHSLLNLDQKATQASLFSQYELKLATLDIQAGLRFSQFTLHNSLYAQPQISVTWKLPSSISFKASFANRVQNLNQFDFETRFAQNLKYYYLSDGPNLPLQKSNNYMLGFRYSADGFFTDVETYYQKSSGNQLFTTLINDVRGMPGQPIPPMYAFFTGKGTTRGMDVLLGYSLHKWKMSMAYTLSKTTQQFEGIYRNLTIPSPDDRRHNFNYSNQYQTGMWTFSQSLHVMSGSPYLSYEKSKDKGTKNEVNRQDLIAYLPSYLSLDAGFDRHFSVGKFRIKAGITVSNLTNHTNVKFVQQTGLFENKKGQLPIVTGNQSVMLGRFFNIHLTTSF
ncbi:MAG: TonB-dependent receptor [Saprospiraceae bacterium]|nr:TonB-dependent receptor [Saprospiraceae bacterium]